MLPDRFSDRTDGRCLLLFEPGITWYKNDRIYEYTPQGLLARNTPMHNLHPEQ
jgi:hypothetical protein